MKCRPVYCQWHVHNVRHVYLIHKLYPLEKYIICRDNKYKHIKIY